ncbi:hypothetical protein [Chitinophaga sp. Cy-1792]|uniref:hypothetical protein n=1 Tax=Chitinophaga sp. Cy-1792 TaxID=2608339 RepID=UPI0014222459|nr:hypothetical protein [Chitinophaga sp. Cy-1792]NIG55638.1 hypothetical protein [Chitinophaga sp. Cy-1792]
MPENRFRLTPEVPGGLGPNTIIDKPGHPPIIKHLHFQFADWLGDDLIESFPCFLVTESMYHRLLDNNISGITANKNVEFSFYDIFYDLNPDGKSVPEFIWINISSDGNDDFYIDKEKYLNVSQKALHVLKEGNLRYCKIAES